MLSAGDQPVDKLGKEKEKRSVDGQKPIIWTNDAITGIIIRNPPDPN